MKMVPINYFRILFQLELWFMKISNREVGEFEKNQEIFQESLGSRKQFVSGFLARMGFIQLTSDDIKAVLRLSEFLDVPIVITSSIQKLHDSSTYQLGPEGLKSVFQEVTERIKPYQDKLREQIVKFDIYERTRLQEAFHSLREECYFSTIVNAVVTLENRLLFLLKRENEAFLRNKRKDLRFTLGQIIEIYIENKTEFNNIVPKKFEALLKLCNTYRIFSVHAKEEEMSSNDAKAVLNLTFSFLLDDRCSIKKLA